MKRYEDQETEMNPGMAFPTADICSPLPLRFCILLGRQAHQPHLLDAVSSRGGLARSTEDVTSFLCSLYGLLDVEVCCEALPQTGG